MTDSLKIIGERCFGKTTELIKLSSQSNIRILCSCHSRARAIYKQAIEMSLSIPFPITPPEIGHESGKEFAEIYVDDIDEVLQSFIYPKISAMTMNADCYTERWIPCKERLPEVLDGKYYSDDVLISVKDGFVATACYYPPNWRQKTGVWYESTAYEACEWSEEEVVAWMPLPDPYKGDSDGDN